MSIVFKVRSGIRRASEFALSYPLFRVASDWDRTPGCCQMRLLPTLALTMWIAIGALISFAPLLPWTSARVVALGAASGWTCLIIRQLYDLKSKADKLGPHFSESPYATQRARQMAWLPAAMASFFGLLASGMVQQASAPPVHEDFLILVLLATGFIVFYLLLPRWWQLKLPAVDTWFAELPTPLQNVVRQSTAVVPAPAPSAAWRTIPDLSQQVQVGGAYEAFFSEDDNERPIWRRSRLYVLWYFAPIVIPFACLLAGPLLWTFLDSAGVRSMPAHTKLLYGLSAAVWATWAMSFFTVFTKRDFVQPLLLAGRADLRIPATLLPFPHDEVRRAARSFFVGSGAAVFNLFVTLLVPAYATYIGLFPTSDVEPARPGPSCTEFDRTLHAHLPAWLVRHLPGTAGCDTTGGVHHE